MSGVDIARRQGAGPVNQSLVAVLLALGAVSVAAPATADFPDREPRSDFNPKLMNPRIVMDLRSPIGDTTWVGYNPAYAGSNFWSIGGGRRRPRGTFGPGKGDIVPVPNSDTGYWEWDHPVHGDSLQGWWPIRHLHTGFTFNGQNDKLRPWHAVDMGNQVSYVINQ